MGERMHSKEFLAERLEGLKYEYGETFIPVSADTEEILRLPIETLKTRFPERYRLYVQALRDQNIWQAGDLGDETFRKKLAILNGIDRYIETHHDPQEETVLRPHQISSMEKFCLFHYLHHSFLRDNGSINRLKRPFLAHLKLVSCLI